MGLQIEVISDVVCPWCYIGKRRLAAALELYRERNPQASAPLVRWQPFQLNPELPADGVERAGYLRRKFGARAADIYGRITAVGASVGIAFAFDKLARQPNTLAAHSLIELAAGAGRQDEVVEALFRAYFIDAKDLTLNETLAAIAIGAGLAPEDVAACLASEAARERVRALELSARNLGVQGVPFFVLNRRYAVSGAQEPEVLLAAMLEAECEAPRSSPAPA
ncbi:MAG: DsbA family oxidoreductase [Betaproteobacteria bacterium]|nr:DsbA family oxidoreductase [Betaproteobacteria bacterium]